MACSCGKKTQPAPKNYVYTGPTGEQKTYKSEIEAVAAVKRSGGTYRTSG